MKIRIFYLVLLLPVFVQAQTDEINISAAFTTSISLRITGNPNVEWVIASVSDYTDGFAPNKRKVAFEVSSSVNYSVELAMTEMTTASGDVLDIGNIGFRVDNTGGEMRDKHGSSYVWAFGSNVGYSDIFLASTTSIPILLSGPSGNAGPYEENRFRLRIGLGNSAIRSLSGLPPMLDQNIKPGVYTATVTLTAVPFAS